MQGRMVAGMAAVLCAAATVLGAVSPSRGAALVALSHSGQWITDSQGRVVILHGTNIVAKSAPYLPEATGISEDDAAFLQANGFTGVRLGVIPAGLEPSPGRFDTRYLDSIARTIDLLWRHGIYSLLDFHQDLLNERYGGQGLPAWMLIDDGLPAQPAAGFPGNYFVMAALNRAFDHFWANDPGPRGKGLQDELGLMWQAVAKRFASHPGVLGYDLLNEPWPGTPWATCFPPLGCASMDTATLRPFYDRMTAAVRAVDRTHLLMYEPWLPFDYSAPTAIGKAAGDKAILGFHDYCLATVGVPETPPTRALCNNVETMTFDHAVAHSRSTGDALLLTEFGATSNATELSTIVRGSDQRGIGWLEWQYSSTGTTNGPSGEALIGDPRKPPTGANLNAGNLAILNEPYPQVIAGTPRNYGFQPDSQIFLLNYSVTAPSGKALLSAITDVYLPRSVYPHPRISVRGARIVSKPGSEHLLLRNDPGASQVSVVVQGKGVLIVDG